MNASLQRFLRVQFAPPRFLSMPTAGVDISASGIKVVSLIERAHGLELLKYGEEAQEVAKENGFNTINLFPPQSQTPISIHVGSAYYGLSTLRSSTVTINGYTGISAGEGLVGLTHNNKFYTFDIGTHTAYLAEFNDLLKTISLY
jgi:hypothetical protein